MCYEIKKGKKKEAHYEQKVLRDCLSNKGVNVHSTITHFERVHDFIFFGSVLKWHECVATSVMVSESRI